MSPGAPIDGAALLAEAVHRVALHEIAASATLTLIASENLMPPVARIALCGDLAARYMFDEDPNPDLGQWRFPAAKDAAGLETDIAVPLLRHLGKAQHVNLRPLSGLQAMELVLAALGGVVGDRVIVVATSSGGHYATAGVARRLGLRPVEIAGPDPHRLDLGILAEICRVQRPRLVYIGQCHGLIPFDIKAIATAVRQNAPDALIHADVSHWLGLILGGAVPNPLEQGADSFGGSTHKSFPGPQKGVVLTNSDEIASRLRATQPTVISSHHFGAVAALALTLAAFTDHGAAYATSVVENSQNLGKHLARGGLDVVGEEFGYSHGHQLWIQTEPTRSARQAAEQLLRVGVRVNWLDDLPLPEPALRLGIAEATWLGLKADDMAELADVMLTALTHPDRDQDENRALFQRTTKLRHQATYPYVPELDELTANLAASALRAALAPAAWGHRLGIDPR